MTILRVSFRWGKETLKIMDDLGIDYQRLPRSNKVSADYKVAIRDIRLLILSQGNAFQVWRFYNKRVYGITFEPTYISRMHWERIYA